MTPTRQQLEQERANIIATCNKLIKENNYLRKQLEQQPPKDAQEAFEKGKAVGIAMVVDKMHEVANDFSG